MWRKLRRGELIFWGLLAAAIGAVCVAILAIVLAAARYDLLTVPIAAWYVLILCSLLIALVWAAGRYRRGWQRAERSLAQLSTQPSPERLPAVCGHALLHKPEFVPLIQALFRATPDVQYIQLAPLTGGYGGDITLEVSLRGDENEDPLPQRYVVKIGDRDAIAGEAQNYHAFVSAALVGQEVLHQTATWGKYAGAAYKFVGLAPGNTIQTFAEFYASARTSIESVTLIAQIFERLSGAWYRRGRITESDLFKEYGLLAEKLTPIGLAIAALVDEGDPYLRTNLNRTEPPWPTGRPAFCRRAELPWYDPLAFLHEWPERSLALPLHRAVIHGDLHARNILIEIGQDAEKRPWFIDFSHTGNGLAVRRRDLARDENGEADPKHGPTVYDFCRLEADLKFLATRLADPGDLDMALQFDAALLGYAGDWAVFPDAPPPGDAWADERFRKAWHVIAAIRRQAAGYLAGPADLRPYYFGLLRATLPTVYYQVEQFAGPECARQQKRFALLSAGMLCDRLKR